MAYATKDDITALYGADELLRVAEDEASPGELDEAGVTAGLANASAEIDGYVGVKYPLPLAASTPTLQRLCVDIALYRLALKAGPRTDEHRTRYEDAVALLTKIAAGKATIGIPVDQTEETGPDFGSGFLTWERG
ncbi:DUF1320 domain-containing protein [Mesorhizobium sp. M0152]|uniref:gp436 family protein n=1 Tax=Mesorhizobium sp. M0152 TaxID=2956898 RepID=UPI00333A1135